MLLKDELGHVIKKEQMGLKIKCCKMLIMNVRDAEIASVSWVARGVLRLMKRPNRRWYVKTGQKFWPWSHY